MFFVVCLASCSRPDNSANTRSEGDDTIKTAVDTIAAPSKPALEKISILVLPPYNVADASIAPNIRKFLEEEIAKDSSMGLIDFPFRDLMNVAYQNVFDKRYCKPLVGKVDADIFIMSKLDQKKGAGEQDADRWSFAIRIYDVKDDSQTNSGIKGTSLSGPEIAELIRSRRKELTGEIRNHYQQQP